MRTYNPFLWTIFFGISCFHIIYPMKLGNYEKNDVAVNMRHFWSDDYSKNINAIKDVNLKSMRSDLKKENYLSLHANALDHLLYLSTVRKENVVKTLFTQKQQTKFDTAFKIKRSVPWFFAINGVVIVGTALLPFTNFSALSQCSNSTQSECLSQVIAVMTPTVASVAGAFVVGFISLYATGLSPDLSSRKADKVQDEIGHLSHKYATIAKYLIDIYFESPEQARYITNKFDIEELKLRAQQKTYKAKAGSSLVSPLEEAWHFIKHGNVLVTFTEIENYLYNKIYCRRIQSLEGRIESLEKMVHEKNAEIEKAKQEKI